MFSEVYKAIDDIADYLVAQGVEIPDAYKRRDPLEPGRTEKEMFEDKLAKLIKRRFNAQKKLIAESLRWTLPKKNVSDWMGRIGDLSDPESEKRIFNLFIGAMEHNNQLFGESIGFDLDWEQVNTDASKWAQKYQTQWLAGLDKTTVKRLRRELTNFVEIQGYTIGDVMRGLPFDEARAMRIATTEITRVYAQAEQLAGEQLIREFPDVPVIKTWFTNNDDLVCPICAPLNMTTVPIDQEFTDGIDTPPAHVNCRCWMSSRTDIGGELEAEGVLQTPITGGEASGATDTGGGYEYRVPERYQPPNFKTVEEGLYWIEDNTGVKTYVQGNARVTKRTIQEVAMELAEIDWRTGGINNSVKNLEFSTEIFKKGNLGEGSLSFWNPNNNTLYFRGNAAERTAEFMSKFKPGWFAGNNDLRTNIWHEVAHGIDDGANSLWRQKFSSMPEDVIADISNYALSDYRGGVFASSAGAEAFAEAVAAFGTGQFHKLTPEMITIIERIFYK